MIVCDEHEVLRPFSECIMTSKMKNLADQALILRSQQRDLEAVNRLDSEINDLLTELLPKKGAFSSIRSHHSLISRLCYYNYTTLSGNQTLGEEYVGIVLSRANLISPSKINLTCMIMLRVLGPYILPQVLKLWEKSLKKSTPNDQESILQLAKRMFILKETLGTLQIARNAIFYLTGSLYDIPMLVTGIKFVLLRPWLQDKKVTYYFRLLGVITLIHSVINAVDKWFKLQYISGDDFQYENTTEKSGLNENCYLCMERRKNTSATPCGHLFCWNCIIEATRVKNVCPLCREKVNPSRVVFLKNYD